MNTRGVRPVQEVVEGMATTGSEPSPAEIIMAGCEQATDVSVTVNVTRRGAGPDVGVTERVAVAGPVVTTVVVEPLPGFKFMSGVPPVVVGIYMPHGLGSFGILDTYLVPVHTLGL